MSPPPPPPPPPPPQSTTVDILCCTMHMQLKFCCTCDTYTLNTYFYPTVVLLCCLFLCLGLSWKDLLQHSLYLCLSLLRFYRLTTCRTELSMSEDNRHQRSYHTTGYFHYSSMLSSSPESTNPEKFDPDR